MKRKESVIIMGFNYNLTALQVLQQLGYTEPIGQAALTQMQQEKNFKLPAVLFEFLSFAQDCPLLSTADIWTEGQDSLFTLYEEIQEMIEEDKDYWEENPEKAESEFYQFYKLPKEQWESRVPDYLQIGSDYGAGVVRFGIRLSDLEQDDPPVYMNHECDSLTDWKLWSKSVSSYLMMVLCDALCCGEYDTAGSVLEEQGWESRELSKKDFSELVGEPAAMLKVASMYGADALCGCAYDEGQDLLVVALVDKEDDDYFYGLKYRKESGRQNLA